jgi:hypothetical protein
MAKRKSAKIPAKKADDNPTAKATPPRDNIEQLESLPLVLTAELGRTSGKSRHQSTARHGGLRPRADGDPRSP